MPGPAEHEDLPGEGKLQADGVPAAVPAPAEAPV